MILKAGWFLAIITVLLAGVSVAIATQQQIQKNNIVLTQTREKIAFSDQDWRSAKEMNLELLKHDPEKKQAWFNLGLARHYLGEYEESRHDWLKSKELGQEPGIVHYNLACSYARENNTREVLEHIKVSRDLGFNVKEFSETDPDLEIMRRNPAFLRIVESGGDSHWEDTHHE